MKLIKGNMKSQKGSSRKWSPTVLGIGTKGRVLIHLEKTGWEKSKGTRSLKKNDQCFYQFLLLCNNLPQTYYWLITSYIFISQVKHSFTGSSAPCLTKLLLRYCPVCVLIWRLGWRRVCFQVHSGFWQNSFPCCCVTENLASFWLLTGGLPYFLEATHNSVLCSPLH